MMDVVTSRRVVWPLFLLVVTMVGRGAWAGSIDRADSQPQTVAAGTCLEPDGRAELLVRVDGIRNAVGNLRINVYDDNSKNFLVKGKKLYRIDVPARPGTMEVCVPVPGAGTYALVAFHDQNANGKVNITKDGFGFSNNPKVGLRRPRYKDAAFIAGPGRTEVNVHLRYLFREKDKRLVHAGN